MDWNTTAVIRIEAFEGGKANDQFDVTGRTAERFAVARQLRLVAVLMICFATISARADRLPTALVAIEQR